MSTYLALSNDNQMLRNEEDFFQSHLGHVSDFGSGHPGPAVAGDAAEHADAAVADPAAPDHHRQHRRLPAAARAQQPVAEMNWIR